MSKNPNTSTEVILRIVGAYIVTLMLAILVIVLAIMIFIDTTKCSAVSKAFPVLLGTIAVVFLASLVFVRGLAWKNIPSVVGRWAIMVVYGVVLFVSYIVIAFVLLVAFNC
jgi:hypothetical protein